MTSPRFDGASLVPAARLRMHGGRRRILCRLVPARAVPACRGDASGWLMDDAAYAVCGRGRTEIEVAGLRSSPG